MTTLGFFSIRESGAGETAFDMTPFSGNALQWFTQKTFALNNLPTFDDSFSFPSDQVAGEVPDASGSTKGKVQLAANLDTAAGEAVQGSDTRLGSVKGRRNSDAVTGLQPVVRLIEGTNVTIALAEAGGELQFTISANTPTRVRSSSQQYSSVTNMVHTPSDGGAYTPRYVIVHAETSSGPTSSTGTGRGTGAGDQGLHFVLGTGRGVVNGIIAGNTGLEWTLQTFSNASVAINRTAGAQTIAVGQVMVVGDAP